MTFSNIELLGTVFFAVAVIHTFCVGFFIRTAHHFPENSWQRSVLHLLGEIEVVFALWAALFMSLYVAMAGWAEAIHYQRSLDFTEPFFIFVVMVICSTRPILTVARQGILVISHTVQKIFRTPETLTNIFVLMIVGPLSGSFITEPAAMTVTAFLLNSMFARSGGKVLYAVIAVLFVNVSIGGALTPFAAPPILMVAAKWGWDLPFIFANFGWKSAVAVVINTVGLVLIFRKEFKEKILSLQDIEKEIGSREGAIPVLVTILHLLFLAAVVVTGHDRNAFLGLFLLFLGLVSITQAYQTGLRLKESLLVAVFLGGIIQFGAFQKWWLAPLLASMDEMVLFGGAVVLTAITDNAALTYLGSQVADLSAASKYALVAGAIAGGGLTVIANAPNAAGYAILSQKFPDGLKPVSLLLAALLPTAVAVTCLWFL